MKRHALSRGSHEASSIVYFYHLRNSIMHLLDSPSPTELRTHSITRKCTYFTRPNITGYKTFRVSEINVHREREKGRAERLPRRNSSVCYPAPGFGEMRLETRKRERELKKKNNGNRRNCASLGLSVSSQFDEAIGEHWP